MIVFSKDVVFSPNYCQARQLLAFGDEPGVFLGVEATERSTTLSCTTNIVLILLVTTPNATT